MPAGLDPPLSCLDGKATVHLLASYASFWYFACALLPYPCAYPSEPHRTVKRATLTQQLCHDFHRQTWKGYALHLLDILLTYEPEDMPLSAVVVPDFWHTELCKDGELCQRRISEVNLNYHIRRWIDC